MGSKVQESKKLMWKWRGIWYCALLAMILGGIVDFYFNGCMEDMEGEMTGHNRNRIAQLAGSVKRGIEDGSITSVIKFLNFCIAKCLQFRFLWPLQPSTVSSLLFWVALTRSISAFELMQREHSEDFTIERIFSVVGEL